MMGAREEEEEEIGRGGGEGERERGGGDMGHKLGQRYGNEIEMEWNEMDTPAAH